MSVLLMGCQSDSALAFAERQPLSHYGYIMPIEQNRNLLAHFITDKLSGDYGVYTNYLDTKQTDEVATGHEVLSESAGLMMRYYALTNQKEKFDHVWAQAKRTFDRSSGLSYRYSPKNHKQFAMNTTVDDLRILRALDEASTTFQLDSYKTDLKEYGNRLFQYNMKNNTLRDFYDDTYHMTNSFITLCYIDMASMELLPVSSKKKNAALTSMLDIVKQGFLTESFPFYQTRYDYDSHSYRSESINTVEALLTILNLAEIKQEQMASIRYIKDHVKAGTLYGKYALDGTPLNNVQSTAIYAITAMIGSTIGDQELYVESITRMNAMQVQTPGSPLHGGFGDEGTQMAYSFDNLMALLAYIY
ncbi:hypothetical protein [Paenibacillus roseipurpureus]|uniref:Glycosyl hydrolase family 8 n=1 Tax=Paenibacillus roseopurpureus TaxID=2918901 RepID=A0AA96LP27_9BACL|nr:hypothetical protein [Paenibacillus sp. MBLB1832]WNR42325.1 hypothetical protein MJB10_14385 [Paenibacillus sp. MBLB1832]